MDRDPTNSGRRKLRREANHAILLLERQGHVDSGRHRYLMSRRGTIDEVEQPERRVEGNGCTGTTRCH